MISKKASLPVCVLLIVVVVWIWGRQDERAPELVPVPPFIFDTSPNKFEDETVVIVEWPTDFSTRDITITLPNKFEDGAVVIVEGPTGRETFMLGKPVN